MGTLSKSQKSEKIFGGQMIKKIEVGEFKFDINEKRHVIEISATYKESPMTIGFFCKSFANHKHELMVNAITPMVIGTVKKLVDQARKEREN